jgi:hypothetical protein
VNSNDPYFEDAALSQNHFTVARAASRRLCPRFDLQKSGRSIRTDIIRPVGSSRQSNSRCLKISSDLTADPLASPGETSTTSGHQIGGPDITAHLAGRPSETVPRFVIWPTFSRPTFPDVQPAIRFHHRPQSSPATRLVERIHGICQSVVDSSS